ncbi:MAG: BrnA antitoxin family protein [Leptolyngbyaceae bacterium]|nr:BrnA antitoxin family protein [Leptolyngbyaceae bacterium]
MEAEYDFSQGKRGALESVSSGKTRITIRLDNEVLEWFRHQVHVSGGGNYQTLINNALREHIQHQQEPMEEVFRRVLREELKLTAEGSVTTSDSHL